MAQPTPYSRQYNFTDYQTTNPASPLPAAQLDAELNAVKLTSDQTRTNLGLIQRDDGKLSNQSVHKDSFDRDALILLGADGFDPKGSWASATAYVANDLVDYNDATYLCLSAHTSTASFATDLAAGYWILIANAAIGNTSSSVDYYEGDGSTLVFTTTYNYPSSTGVQVYVNGVLQLPTDGAVTGDYDLVGNTLTFVTAPPAPSVAGRKNVVVWGANVTVQANVQAAQTYAANAQGYAAAALVSQNAAAASEAAAATSESNAASSETAAAASQSAASSSQSAAATSASNAASSATAAATSATNAASSETAAAASEAAAASSETAALASQTAAASSATAAAASATTATNQASSATTSASSASSSASNAATSESNAATSATQAATSATNAANSATAAAGSATSANTYKTDAASSASAAAASATAAASSQTAAASSAAAASSSETNAASSETNAATSATNAASSATAAAASASTASTAATSAAASYDAFDDRYLGAKASAPATDNDGDALVVGALYFDTTSDTMKVYSASGWTAAGSSVNGTANRYDYVVGTASGSYTGASNTTFPATYDAGYVDVWLNGAKLVPTTDFTATSGTQIVLTSAASAGANVCIVGYGTFSLSTAVPRDSTTGAADIPTGTTAERPATAATGMFRFNSSLATFEGYNGSAWGEIGGGGGATGGGSDAVFFENAQTVTTNYTITANRNAGTFGPITINSGVSVTVPSGSVWTIV